MGLPIEVPDWTRAIQLVGQDPSGNPILVALDATGNIIAVLKATYAGVLKNVACDSEGRMIMIPTDPADVWGNAISMGNAELAVRLGYPGGYDDRGRTLFTDSFEEGLVRGFGGGAGTGAAYKVSSTSSRMRGLALKLTAGSNSLRLASYGYFLPYPTLSKVGLQCAFTVEANTEYFRVAFWFYDGTHLNYATIRYDHVNQKVQYYDSAGAWQDLITSINLVGGAVAYHYLKMVIDLATMKYHRVSVDGYSWVAGNLSLQVTTDPSTTQFFCKLFHYGAAATNAVSYVDNVIITQNEPA